MAGVHGERMYGYVDRVPGFCYVSTQFFHFNFVPLFPLGSYVVLEGSESEKGFQGKRIGFNLKSILLGYFRGWVGLTTIVMFAIAGVWFSEIVLENQRDVLTRVAIMLGLVALGGCAIWAFYSTHRSWWMAWLVVIAATGGYFWWDAENPQPPLPANPFKAAVGKWRDHRQDIPNLLIAANGCLLALSVLRTFDHAGRGRAYELGETLGFSEEQMDALWANLHGSPVGYDGPDPNEEYRDQRSD